ncbi:MAG TPA: hypothetical protein PKI64_09930, partial [Kiritimatiellia bacterium]|nr:hypothetical protein [Kiritimatiellia bacterium]HOU59959.1 hypothetical protein [Kiritimatiellia bacterium]
MAACPATNPIPSHHAKLFISASVETVASSILMGNHVKQYIVRFSFSFVRKNGGHAKLIVEESASES